MGDSQSRRYCQKLQSVLPVGHGKHAGCCRAKCVEVNAGCMGVTIDEFKKNGSGNANLRCAERRGGRCRPARRAKIERADGCGLSSNEFACTTDAVKISTQ